MEICYYWIEGFSDVIKEQGYNFGSELAFNYEKYYCKKRQREIKELVISENNLYIEGFFNNDNSNRIKNITAVCGQNGVGKSTFLKALKGLLKDGGILAEEKDNDEVEYSKRILVIKSKGEFNVLFHTDLTPFIRYDNKEIQNKYKINLVEYGYGENIQGIKGELLKVSGTEVLSNTSCIYSSQAFDNNFYSDLTQKELNYYDISTKGLLNEMERKLTPSKSSHNVIHDYDHPNHKNFKDERFNVGLLKEYYISESIKRINFLDSEIGRNIIEKHGFFPEQVYIKLDSIISREENFSLDNIDNSNLLRSERREGVNYIENYIYKHIDNFIPPAIEVENNSSLKLQYLAKQTIFHRILDSYFNDVDHYLAFQERINHIEINIKKTSNDKKVRKEMKGKNLEKLLKYYTGSVIAAKRNHVKNDKLVPFFEDQFIALTKSYINFIQFLEENVFVLSPNIHFKESEMGFVTTDSAAVRSSKNKTIGYIAINLTSEGTKLLQRLIEAYQLIDTASDFLKIQWGDISTGEDAIINIYSRLYHLKTMHIKEEIQLKENMLLLFDEIEHSLHPEWQRTLIDNLINYLPEIFSMCTSIQIVLATNVPFLIADIPTKNVVYLEKIQGKTASIQEHNIPEEVNYTVGTKRAVDQEGKTRISIKEELANQTFAANIHSLLMNNFFMQSTLGAFSERKIRELINILEEEPKEDEVKRNYTQEEIKTTIQTIGEPIIRNKLNSRYAEKFGKDVREAEIKKLIADFQESEDNIPANFKRLLDEISRQSERE